MTTHRGAGVYVFRTRRPGLIGRLYPEVVFSLTCSAVIGLWLLGMNPWLGLAGALLWPTHFAYVGESTAVQLRKSAHIDGGGKFGATAKPWADLVTSWHYLPLPGAPKWVLRSVETVGILLLWPVYNHKKNLWNPRRISLRAAKVQRLSREKFGWSFNFQLIHMVMWTGALVLVAINGGWWQ